MADRIELELGVVEPERSVLQLRSGQSRKLTAREAVVLAYLGAEADNVFWQVSGLVDIGATAHMEGNIVTSTSLNMRTGASLNGRLLAQTAVDLDGSTVTAPQPSPRDR
jgi:hypothetical protein